MRAFSRSFTGQEKMQPLSCQRSAAGQMATGAACLLPTTTLDRGVKLLGHAHALDALFSRLHSGKPITLGILGASVGQNGGCLDQPGKRCMGYRGRHRGEPLGFALRLLRHINRTWPADHRINNSALDGTGVEHMAKCVVSHLPQVHLGNESAPARHRSHRSP